MSPSTGGVGRSGRGTGATASGRVVLPEALGDDLDPAVDDADRCLVIDGICRARHPCRPPRGLLQRVPRLVRALNDMRADGEVDQTQSWSSPLRRTPLDEVVADQWSHDHAAGAGTHPDCLGQGRQQVREARTRASNGQVERVPTRGEEDIGLLDDAASSARGEARQRGELENPTDFQPRSTIGCSRSAVMNSRRTQDRPPGWPYIAVGMHSALDSAIGLPASRPTRRGSRVPDAGGGEQELHRSSPSDRRIRFDQGRQVARPVLGCVPAGRGPVGTSGPPAPPSRRPGP